MRCPDSPRRDEDENVPQTRTATTETQTPIDTDNAQNSQPIPREILPRSSNTNPGHPDYYRDPYGFIEDDYYCPPSQPRPGRWPENYFQPPPSSNGPTRQPPPRQEIKRPDMSPLRQTTGILGERLMERAPETQHEVPPPVIRKLNEDRKTRFETEMPKPTPTLPRRPTPITVAPQGLAVKIGRHI